MLRLFLPSVISCSQGEGIEVCVADNGSSDDSCRIVEGEFPSVRLIRLPENYGFADGYNKALEQVDAEYVVLLNSDVEVSSGWLSAMVSYMDLHPEVAACHLNSRLEKHFFGDKWSMNWSGSYSKTSSDEPDRRQIMFIREGSEINLFKLNRQETMRYFGVLDEKEWVGNLSGDYKFGNQNKLQAGFTYKDKTRDYSSTRFYYNLNKLNPVIGGEEDIYTPSGFLNQEAIESGLVSISRSQQPKDSYTAGNKIYAGYILADIYPVEALLVNVGVRYESSKQWVNYAEDGGKLQRLT